MSLCDIDNNWVLLLFTSCTLLTLSVNLVGGMGIGEANPSHYDGCIRFCIPSYCKIVCIEEVNIPQMQWHVLFVNLQSYLAYEWSYHFTLDKRMLAKRTMLESKHSFSQEMPNSLYLALKY